MARESALKATEGMETYTYKVVEAALADVFKITSEFLPAFKARINGLQRNGMTPEKPGRGRVIQYTRENVYDWALALSISAFGVPASIVTKHFHFGDFQIFINKMNDRKQNANERSHLILIYWPSLFYVEKENKEESIPYIATWDYQLVSQGKFQLTNFGTQIALVNLTTLKANADRALALRQER